MEDSLAPVQPGDVLAGKYRVERVLGAGGMGVVVSASHIHLGQHVAMKFLLPEACKNETAVARFLREARAAVQIKSEHVARVVDVGTLDDGAPYMVMEYLDGHDLSQELQQSGPLPVPVAVDYLLQACEAVAEAHAIGIVHRDLKPANLFLTRRADGSPLVKVLDFGISKLQDPAATDQNLTATQSVMGSPLYMSPEQVRSSKHVDARSDVWSLGVILHELLSGAPPFHADTVSGLLAQIVADPPQPLRNLRPDAPVELESVISRALEKDLEKRIPNVAQLARRLAPFATAGGHVSVERISRVLVAAGHSADIAPSYAPPPAQVSTAAEWTSTQPGAKKGSGLGVILALGAVAVVAVLGVGITLFVLSQRASASAVEPQADPALASAPASATAEKNAEAEPTLELEQREEPGRANAAVDAGVIVHPVASAAPEVAAEPTPPQAPTSAPRRHELSEPRPLPSTLPTTRRLPLPTRPPMPAPAPAPAPAPTNDPLDGRK